MRRGVVGQVDLDVSNITVPSYSGSCSLRRLLVGLLEKEAKGTAILRNVRNNYFADTPSHAGMLESSTRFSFNLLYDLYSVC